MEQLNDYVLYYIFTFLPQHTLQIALKVCSRWHSIISSSLVLTQKLVLIINNKPADIENEEKYDLPYNQINVAEHLEHSDSKKKIFKNVLTKYRDYVKIIKLTGLTDSTIELLPLMSNVTELSLRKHLKWYKIPENFKVDFPSLKSLILFDASSFIDCIRSHKIETLKVAEDKITNSENYDTGDWEKFLRTCVNLKNLTLQSFKRNINWSNYRFELSSLMITGYNLYFFDTIKALIVSQKNSLKEISFAVENLTNPDIINFMIYDLRLEKLNFPYDSRHPMNYVEPTINETIKKLKLKFNDFPIPEDFLDVLKTLHAVEELDVDFRLRPRGNEFYKFLHYNMPNLKTLILRDPSYVKKSGDVFISEIETKVFQVETLIIRGLDVHDDQRVKFISCAPNIKKLFIKGKTFNNFDNLSIEEFKLILKTHPNLEEFEFRGTMNLNREVLALITQSKLRRITIEYVSSKLALVNETCDMLKTANPQMIVMRRHLTSKDWSDNELHEIGHLFVPCREL